MNKSAIEKFAIWARKKLIREITYKAGLLGVTEKGIAEPLPQSAKDMQLFDIGTKNYTEVTGVAIGQRAALAAEIKNRERSSNYTTAFGAVVEEVAYTWFNRLIAIRFMEVNGYLPSRIRVLSSENPAKNEPDFVTTPFETDLSFSTEEQDEIMRFKDENKLDELFQMLFIKQCNQLHEILPELFETTSDYTELLLTISFTDKDGVAYHLTHDIEEKDFDVEKEGQVEIIGWLYQYYNSELKDETFAQLKKNVKITKERIPAATQLFTPDWIVRYMVENSLGRLWVEGHPNDNLKASWKYYLEEAEQEESVKAELEKIRSEYRKLSPEDIKVIDPCMGSGHILVYAFDVLMQIYESCGYTQRDAARSIITNNLYGLDIDRRAYQLAYFAVMMKARQHNRRILTENVQLNLFVVDDSTALTAAAMNYIANGNTKLRSDLQSIKDDLTDAKEYGSLVNISPVDFDAIFRRVEEIKSEPISMDSLYVQEHLPRLFRQAKAMMQKYHAVVTNPPYMGGSGMNGRLSEFVKKNYPNSKSDLFSCFMEKSDSLIRVNGFTSLITMESWMFLSSFEKLRETINQAKTIINMVHMPYLGRGGTSLGINFGTAAVVMKKGHTKGYLAQYEYTVYYECDENGVPLVFPTKNERWKTAQQENFFKIPGSPIAYWASSKMVESFVYCQSIGEIAKPRVGLQTSNNERFIRMWHEVDFTKMRFGITSGPKTIVSGGKWFPHNKGGDYRKWYGNNYYVVDYENDGKNIKDEKAENLRLGLIEKKNSQCWNNEFYFRESLTWSRISSSYFEIRYSPVGFVFDTAGTSIFADTDILKYLLGFLTTKVVESILRILNSTLTFQTGDISKIPVKFENTNDVIAFVNATIEISEHDWNSYEASWDFKKHPML